MKTIPRLQLQDEVWNLVHQEGTYANTNSSAEGYLLFYRTVGEIVRRKRFPPRDGSQ